MKKIFKFATLLAAFSLLALSCGKDELSTDQFEGDAVALQAYGPQPVVRGGQLRFVGTHLEKVVSVTIPEGNVITDIEVVASGKHSEIRVTVPKETAAPGFPVLTLADGTTITGKTQLSYSEPITIESFSPAEILPGETLTIKGDYLNLIHEVVLADKVKISEEAFTAHSRYEIKVVVPETAQTGKFALGTVDEAAAADDEALLKTLNLIQSETDLVVKTAEGKLAAASVKAGDTVTINGTNLNLTKSIVLEGATVSEFTATATKITFALPAVAKDGDVVMVMASGVEVSAGALTTVVPTVTAVAPKPVKNGAELTITGKDLDLVTAVDFPKAGAEFTATATQITIAAVPEKAQEGDITLSLANGKTVTAAFTLVKPTVTGFSANPASAGSDVTINGTDLDLVTAVTFGGGTKVDVPDGSTADAITLSVPTTAETAVLVLNLKNGSDVNAIELQIDKPAGAYLSSVPQDVFKVGDMFIADIVNEDHLQKVLFDAIECNYLLNGGKLYTVVPEGVKAGSQLHLVSDNGEVVYDINIDPGDKVEVVVWTGPSGHTGDYAANQELGGEDDWVNAGLQEGDEIRIYFTPDDPNDWSIQVFDGHWNGMSYVTPNGVQWNNENDPEAVERGYVSFRAKGDAFTALSTHAWWGSALILQGKNMVFSKLSYVHYFPQETTVWNGPSAHTGDYAANQELGGEDDWVNAGLADGDEIRIYFTPDDPNDWSIQVFDGHWNGMSYVTPNGVQWNNENDPEAPERGYVSFVATGDAFTAMTTHAWWGSALILQGKNLVFNKLSFVHIP